MLILTQENRVSRTSVESDSLPLAALGGGWRGATASFIWPLILETPDQRGCKVHYTSVGHSVASSATVLGSQWNWGQDPENTGQVTERFPRTRWQCRPCNYVSRPWTVEWTQAAISICEAVPGAQASMESGVWAQGGSTCRVQVRPSASLLACPASTVSALSHCPASASLEGLAQACPSAPMIPACPCWSTDRADAYPVPCDLVSAFHLLPVAPASWLCLPPAFIPTVPSSAISWPQMYAVLCWLLSPFMSLWKYHLLNEAHPGCCGQYCDWSSPPCCPQFQSLTGFTFIWSQYHHLLTHCIMSWVVMGRVYLVPPSPSPLGRVSPVQGYLWAGHLYPARRAKKTFDEYLLPEAMCLPPC